MLNELHEIKRALASAGITVAPRHPDVKDVTARATLRVDLDAEGTVRRVRSLSGDEASQLWTLRDGQHNSFPYHQIKPALLGVDPEDERLKVVCDKRGNETKRWTALRACMAEATLDEQAFAAWPGDGYLKRLGKRRAQLAALRDTNSAAVPAVFDRFLRAAEQPLQLLQGIVDAILRDVQKGRITDLPLIASVLVDGGAPLFFDVSGDFPRFVRDERNVPEISRVLTKETTGEPNGICTVTGSNAFLVGAKFPQPNLPILGQTFLFARNKDAPTNARYGRSGTDAVAVGTDTAAALQAAAEVLTRDEWKDRTWRGIPGERPKQQDLLIAFVPGAEDVPLAAMLSEDAEPKPGAEGRFASFAERLTQAFEGKVKARKETPLSLFVLRKLDPANRKVAYSATLDVDALLNAARRWSDGCGNVPPPIHLPIPTERGQPPRWSVPWDVAPFSLPRLTRQHFIRGGTQRQEIVGLTYDESMRLFLAPEGTAAAPACAALRRVLHSRGVLLEGVGHAQRRGFDDLKEFDRREALNTVTLLGLLLHKLGRTREEYMEEVAYKLGRLLATADALHAGYNASERGGSALPPRLIGNAVLPLAQSDPTRALDVLGRRWGVYAGWAKRNAGFRVPESKPDGTDERARQENARAWQIRNGITAARRASDLAKDLHGRLPERSGVDEQFRAELLLGYLAGPPRANETTHMDGNDNPEPGEE